MKRIYVLGSLGALVHMTLTARIYQNLKVDLTVYSRSTLIAKVASVCITRSYYIKKQTGSFSTSLVGLCRAKVTDFPSSKNHYSKSSFMESRPPIHFT